MAEAAIFPQRLTAYTNSDWNEEPFEFFLGSLGAPEDFTGASAKMGFRLSGATSNAFELRTADETLALTLPNEIGITAPLSLMETVAPGLYSFDLVVTYASGVVETVAAGQVQVVAGITS